MADRFYTDEQAQEILRMASHSSMGSGTMSQRQLLETAAELGIRPEDVLQAENAFFEQERLAADRLEFKKHKRREIVREISQFISVAVMLYGIAFVMNGFALRGLLQDWPEWPVGIMGIFLIKSTIESSLELTVNQDTAFEKWRRKRDKKLAAKAEAEVEVNAEAIAASYIVKAQAELESDTLPRNQARS